MTKLVDYNSEHKAANSWHLTLNYSQKQPSAGVQSNSCSKTFSKIHKKAPLIQW